VDVYINGTRVKLDPKTAKGKGGEADIFLISPTTALKLFKQSNHPDYAGNPHEQNMATKRLEIHQKKLASLPKGLPTNIISPIDLVTDKNKQIIGYTMPFIDNAEPLFKYGEPTREGIISNNVVKKIFSMIHPSIIGAHDKGLTFGDFNDLNILVKNDEPFIIDIDSSQFGSFLCFMFTTKFVDPLLCDQKAKSPQLIKQYNPEADWYAFSVMLMQCLIFVDPYGGVYKPKDPKNLIPQPSRPLHRITIFNPEVKPPRPALPYQMLSDDLLQYFYQVFEKDIRGELPIKLIQNQEWKTCPVCKREFDRPFCPICQKFTPALVKETTTVRGTVTCTRMFTTNGMILFAASFGGKLYWLSIDKNGEVFREQDTKVGWFGAISNYSQRFRIAQNKTFIGRGNQLSYADGFDQGKIIVDKFGNLPVFDVNEKHHYWITNGQLMKNGKFGNEFIGEVLKDQTLFWVGPTFGFGFYRAGNISVAFVFDAERKGINDSVKLKIPNGQLIDSTCFFSSKQCWFFVSIQQSGNTVNYCYIITKEGEILNQCATTAGDGSWLSGIRGKCAAGDFLLAATDDGIVRVENTNGSIKVTKEFPDTEPFVDSGSHIFPGSDGIYVVKKQEISLLKIK